MDGALYNMLSGARNSSSCGTAGFDHTSERKSQNRPEDRVKNISAPEKLIASFRQRFVDRYARTVLCLVS